MILIYSHHIDSTRLQYILQELFTRRLGMKYELTDNLEKVNIHAGALINYTHETIENCIQVKPHALLFENEITNQTISCKHDYDWDTLLFAQLADIPFDIFAASFYLLSRYEEYLPHKIDDHGRFDPEQSIAIQFGFIETPLIDKWILKFKDELIKKFGPINNTPPQYKFISTVDIDTAYLYKGLKNYRQFRKTIKSATLFRINKLAEQVQVLHRNQKDPYDTYAYIEEITKNCERIYFVLSGGESEYDEALPLATPEMQLLLQKLKQSNTLGIHFSYNTLNDTQMMQTEIKALQQTIQQTVSKNRQHFLRFSLPQTMNLLIKNGITEDYSMAYGDVCGFRSSTAHAYHFFDLETNTSTNLLLYPTTLMDVTLRYNMNLTTTSAIHKAEQLIQEVKQVNGTFISIWHNSNLSTTNDWLTWREVFEKIHSLAQ